MKKFLLFLLLSITFIGTKAQIQNYNLNDVVNDFTVTDIHGEIHNLYDYTSQGKYVFLDFFFDTCPPCQATSPIFNEFYDKYGCNEGDVICLTINNGSDSNAEVEAYENTYGGSFNHAPAIGSEGGALAVDNDLNPAAYPTYCLINPNNELIVSDIWPIAGVETFEATFPSGFNPQPSACSALSTNDLSAQFDFNIFPNPSSSKIYTVTLNDSSSKIDIAIYTILGKKVFSQSFNNTTFQFELPLSAGTYFVQINVDNSIVTKKLLVN